MLKSKIGSVQEVVLPDFPDDDNTVTTTVTKSRRVSFGTNFVKEFIVGSAVSAQCMSEYEEVTPSSDSSNANSSQSVAESGILDRTTFAMHDSHKVHKSVPVTSQSSEHDSVDSRPKPPKFSSTICFSADSPTADMEFTEGCLTLAKSILDKKNKEMTVIIQAKSKDSKDEQKPREDETKYYHDDDDDDQFEMSMTRCLKATDLNEGKERKERRFESEKTRIFGKFEDEMSITRCQKMFTHDESENRWEESKENRMPLDMIIQHLDKDNSDLENDLFSCEKSVSSLFNANPFDFSNESEESICNEHVDMSIDLQPNLCKAPQKAPTPAREPCEIVNCDREPSPVDMEVIDNLKEASVNVVRSLERQTRDLSVVDMDVENLKDSSTVSMDLTKNFKRFSHADMDLTGNSKKSSPVGLDLSENLKEPSPVVMDVIENSKQSSPVRMDLTENLKESSLPVDMNLTGNFKESSRVNVEANKNLKITSPERMDVPEIVKETSEVDMDVTGNVKETSEVDMDVTENIKESSEVSMDVTENIKETSEVGMEVTENLKESSGVGMVVTEKIKDSSEVGMEVTENLKESSGVGMFVTEKIKDSSEVGMEVAENIKGSTEVGMVVTENVKQFSQAGTDWTEYLKESSPPNTEPVEIVKDQSKEPSLIDLKVIENLREQSKEPGCVWSLENFLHPQNDAEGLLSFNCKLLESSASIHFRLKMPKEDDLYACSVITNSDISLNTQKQWRLPEYQKVVEFGFQQLNKYYEELRRKVLNTRHIPYFLDQINSFTFKMNSLLRQIYSILTLYPGSGLKDSLLSFRLFSFPIFFSCVVSIDLTNLLRLSKSSLVLVNHFGSLDENKIREIFQDCLKCDNSLCEFVIQSTKYLVDIEKESGYVSKRGHIRLLPPELKL